MCQWKSTNPYVLRSSSCQAPVNGNKTYYWSKEKSLVTCAPTWKWQCCVLQSSLEPVFCSWVQNCVIDNDGAWQWTDCTGAWEVFVIVSPLHHAPLWLEPSQRIGGNTCSFILDYISPAVVQFCFIFFLSQRLKKKKPPPTSLTNAFIILSISHTSQTSKRRWVYSWLFHDTLCWWPSACMPHSVMLASAMSIPGRALATVPL